MLCIICRRYGVSRSYRVFLLAGMPVCYIYRQQEGRQAELPKGRRDFKMALGKMQDRFYGRVGALYGLSRGEKRGDGEPAKRHKSVAEYKAENLRIQAELDEKTEQLESVTAELAVAKDALKTAQDAAKRAKKTASEPSAFLRRALARSSRR